MSASMHVRTCLLAIVVASCRAQTLAEAQIDPAFAPPPPWTECAREDEQSTGTHLHALAVFDVPRSQRRRVRSAFRREGLTPGRVAGLTCPTSNAVLEALWHLPGVGIRSEPRLVLVEGATTPVAVGGMEIVLRQSAQGTRVTRGVHTILRPPGSPQWLVADANLRTLVVGSSRPMPRPDPR